MSYKRQLPLPEWFATRVIEAFSNEKGNTIYRLKDRRVEVALGEWIVLRETGFISTFPHQQFVENFTRHSPSDTKMQETKLYSPKAKEFLAFVYDDYTTLPKWFLEFEITVWAQDGATIVITCANNKDQRVYPGDWIISWAEGKFFRLGPSDFAQVFDQNGREVESQSV